MTAKTKKSKAKQPQAKQKAKIKPALKAKKVLAKKPAKVLKVKAIAKKAPVVAKIAGKPVMKPMAASTQAPARVVPMARPSMTAPRMLGKPPVMHNRPMAATPIRPANDTPVDFRTGDYVVYPAHGVGTIEGIETQSIAGMSVTLYAISFEKDRMRLKIPVQKAQTAGLRKLSSGDRLKDALKTLTGKAKIKRTMWSRRAQEYEAKINSGDPVQIAEVLRDLRRPKDDTEQSYSERQIYQSALERLAREVAAVQRIAEAKAVEHLETVLAQAA